MRDNHTKKPDWYCTGCLCNHGGRVPKQGVIAGLTYCEQTYYRAAEFAGQKIDRHALAAKYRKKGNKYA